MRTLVLIFTAWISMSAILFFPVAAQTAAAPSVAGGTEANKRLVLDFFRVVFEARNAEAAKDFLSEGYLQHNPSVPTGRDGFIGYFTPVFARQGGPKPPKPTLDDPPAEVAAEGDLVSVMWKVNRPEPSDASHTYESFWFDMFRVRDGLIVEHWDNALKK
jgi:predicted SnoaL-like aldol condensation-catalyzing enzyme